MTLADLTYYAFLLRNDLHHIHLHATGKQFDKVHAITDELYTEAQEEVDSLAEMAIAEGDAVKSFTDIRSVVDESQWPTIEGEAFDMDTFITAFDDIGHRYLDAIEDCDCNDIHRAALDEIALFWDKEVNFFNAARKCCPECENCEEDEEELDDTDAMEAASIEDDDKDEEFGLQSMTSDMIVSGYNPLDDHEDDDSGASLWTDIEDSSKEEDEEDTEEEPEEEE